MYIKIICAMKQKPYLWISHDAPRYSGAISTHALHRGTLQNYTVLCILHNIIVYTNNIKISCPQHDALNLNTESCKETKKDALKHYTTKKKTKCAKGWLVGHYSGVRTPVLGRYQMIPNAFNGRSACLE